MRERMKRLPVYLGLTILLVMVGCQATNPGLQTTNTAMTQAATLSKQEITVFAAASLTDAFMEVGQAFEKEHPGVHVNFDFAGSQILRTQIEQGANADVFASADHKNIDALAAKSLVAAGSVKDFATNSLEVIMPPGNPGKINALSDLARPGLKLVLADASVPAGNYARRVFEKMSQDPGYGSDFSARVLANLVSNETDVRQVVAKVELGEADAGIVYFTDAKATPGLLTLTIPPRFNVVASYPIAVLKSATEPGLAQQFVDYVTSADGQAILVGWGFSPPQ